MSSQAPTPPRRGTGSTTRLLARRKDAARALPHPSDELLRDDFPPEVQTVFRLFVYAGIIEPTGSISTDDGREYLVYQTDPGAWAWARENVTDTGPWPRCPHFGIRNKGDGVYSCAEPSCDERYSRADLEGGEADG